MKVVIAKSYYGTHMLPEKFLENHYNYDKKYLCDNNRYNKDLIKFVEESSQLDNFRAGGFEVVDIPTGTQYRISDYDGSEYVEIYNKSDWKIAT